MHLIFLLSDVAFIVRVVDRWTDLVLDLNQSFLVLDQLLLLSV